ncbi:asparagine synthase-related protein [Nocardia sp. NPDC058658]|uniref:asparagine synthase-related protein n=1 Tax=Nocardia sp. NPDC058658 TaxID=3346580 RepID=UPI003659D29E
MTTTGDSVMGAATIYRRPGTTTVQTGILGGSPLYAKFRDTGGWTISDSLRAVSMEAAGCTIDDDLVARLQSEPLSSWPDGLMSFIRDVVVLDPNSTYHFDEHDSRFRVERDRQEWPDSRPLTPTSLIEHLHAALVEADIQEPPLLFLSGGLDSALLAVVMVDCGITFDSVCVYDGHNADDVEYATALATELGVPFSVYEFGYDSFLYGLPSAIAAFSDPRPDLFLASGLVDCLSKIGPDKYETVIGGEPADALLGGLRTQVNALNDASRGSIRAQALRTQIPRDIAILEQSASTIGANGYCPYAHHMLAADALSTPWSALLDPENAIHATTGELGGPGYKILQTSSATLLPSSELRRIARRTKRGLPSSAISHWRTLQAELSGDPGDMKPMLSLGVNIFEQIFVHGSSPSEISVEDSIAYVKELHRR